MNLIGRLPFRNYFFVKIDSQCIRVNRCLKVLRAKAGLNEMRRSSRLKANEEEHHSLETSFKSKKRVRVRPSVPSSDEEGEGAGPDLISITPKSNNFTKVYVLAATTCSTTFYIPPSILAAIAPTTLNVVVLFSTHTKAISSMMPSMVTRPLPPPPPPPVVARPRPLARRMKVVLTSYQTGGLRKEPLQLNPITKKTKARPPNLATPL